MPVIATIGVGADGQAYNINADEAARAIAVAMKAEKIVYLTAVPGLLENPKDETTLIQRLTSAELRERLAHDSVGKGMIPKLKACADAVDQGVAFAHIIDGRVQHSLLIELLTDHGVGTMVTREVAE
jgi:acetylglutamate kinase